MHGDHIIVALLGKLDAWLRWPSHIVRESVLLWDCQQSIAEARPVLTLLLGHCSPPKRIGYDWVKIIPQYNISLGPNCLSGGGINLCLRWCSPSLTVKLVQWRWLKRNFNRAFRVLIPILRTWISQSLPISSIWVKKSFFHANLH